MNDDNDYNNNNYEENIFLITVAENKKKIYIYLVFFCVRQCVCAHAQSFRYLCTIDFLILVNFYIYIFFISRGEGGELTNFCIIIPFFYIKEKYISINLMMMMMTTSSSLVVFNSAVVLFSFFFFTKSV